MSKSENDENKKDDSMKKKVQMELLNFMAENVDQMQHASPVQIHDTPIQVPGKEPQNTKIRATTPKPAGKKEKVQKGQSRTPRTDSKREEADFFKIGDIVDNRFRVKIKFKGGGYGQIYKATDSLTQSDVALKVEKNTFGNENIEGTVLKALQGSSNFPFLYAMGAKDKYLYVVMQLLGDNLSDIRRWCSLSPKRLSLGSTYRSILQFLTTMEVLHNHGFLHRDIKPSNFAVGLGKQHRIIYMLDFGLCRRHFTENGTVKKERENVGFRGTVRYASLAAHEKRDLSRRDDLWSLFYTFVELITGKLPWRKTNDREIVRQMKRKHSPEIFCQLFEPEIAEFVRHIQSLSFADKPDYGKIAYCFNRILRKINVNYSDPYDWELSDCSSLEHWKVPK